MSIIDSILKSIGWRQEDQLINRVVPPGIPVPVVWSDSGYPTIKINEKRAIIDSSDPKLIGYNIERFFKGAHADYFEITVRALDGVRVYRVSLDVKTPLPLPIYIDEQEPNGDVQGKVLLTPAVVNYATTGYLQQRSTAWLKAAWPESKIRADTRVSRFLEEAIELAQALGISRDKMHELVDFVMDKEVGDIEKELGDANFCLLSLAEVLGYDLGLVTHEVINDAYDRIPQIREKSKLKPKVDHHGAGT